MGVDCWGTPIIIYREEHAITLKDHSSEYNAPEDVAGLIRDETTAEWPWQEVKLGRELDFDIVVFARGGIDRHVGVVTGPGEMLHIRAPTDGKPTFTQLEHFDRGVWKFRQPRIYRHAGLIRECHG